MNDLVPKTTQEIRKTGVVGVGSSIAGVGLLVLNALSGGWLGIIGGGLVALGGLGIMNSNEAVDKRMGGLVTAAGAVTAAASILHLIPGLRGLAGLGQFVLWGAGIGLLGVGIYNIIRFVKGLKSRG
jgi:hypothetical protein